MLETGMRGTVFNWDGLLRRISSVSGAMVTCPFPFPVTGSQPRQKVTARLSEECGEAVELARVETTRACVG